eukprot:33612-Pelagomonas_calceolata.AAC.2
MAGALLQASCCCCWCRQEPRHAGAGAQSVNPAFFMLDSPPSGVAFVLLWVSFLFWAVVVAAAAVDALT